MPEPASVEVPASTFDQQASLYDARAGLPPPVGALIARSIVERTGAGPGELVVDVGAGTGEIGAHLSRLPLHYLGLDASAPMLQMFRAKTVGAPPSLILADCEKAWPLRDGAVTVVFASRTAHLLDPEHVTRETIRISRPAGWLVLGRVLRDRGDLKERLRRRRLELLLKAGVSVRQREERTHHLVERCQAAGGESAGRWVVAEWTHATTPAEVITDWEHMSRMGSIGVDPVTRAVILDELRRWTQSEIGDLDRPEAFRERYAIDVIRLP